MMRRGAHNEAGFTLVELMTVLVIIGLMSSAVVLTMSSDKPASEQQAQALIGELNLAAQESLISGKMQGFGLTEDVYALYSLKDGLWQKDFEKPWTDDTQLSLMRESAELTLPEKILPMIYFDPTGAVTDFELTVRHDDRAYLLRPNPKGQVTLEPLK